MLQTVDKAIDQALVMLYKYSKEVDQSTWQSVKSPDSTVELQNCFMQMIIPETAGHLAELTKADMPWAEDHFSERIAGFPQNPGVQWQKWPWYRPMDNERFRGDGTFSHTYMERFWPKGIMTGIRFSIGDYEDIVNRAIKDPYSRQLYLSIWHPEDQSNDEDRRLPCTLGYHFLIRDGQLTTTYFIRSCDAVRHFRNDVYLAGRLAQSFAMEVATKAGISIKASRLDIWIGSLHCFKTEKWMLQQKN